jgi:hypothetical protein
MDLQSMKAKGAVYNIQGSAAGDWIKSHQSGGRV